MTKTVVIICPVDTAPYTEPPHPLVNTTPHTFSAVSEPSLTLALETRLAPNTSTKNSTTPEQPEFALPNEPL